jgi:hypothetical protein
VAGLGICFNVSLNMSQVNPRMIALMPTSTPGIVSPGIGSSRGIMVPSTMSEQTLGTGIVARWQFDGEITQNVERAFATGIRFSTPMNVNLLSSSGDSFAVRIHGFFT